MVFSSPVSITEISRRLNLKKYEQKEVISVSGRELIHDAYINDATNRHYKHIRPSINAHQNECLSKLKPGHRIIYLQKLQNCIMCNIVCSICKVEKTLSIIENNHVGFLSNLEIECYICKKVNDEKRIQN